MAADMVVSRELKSLQDELSATQRERPATPAAPSATPAEPATPSNKDGNEGELREQLRELASEVTSFFEDAEKGIAAHPTQSVVGALLLGILVGRLLGRH